MRTRGAVLVVRLDWDQLGGECDNGLGLVDCPGRVSVLAPRNRPFAGEVIALDTGLDQRQLGATQIR
jgi:hypothetical protein